MLLWPQNKYYFNQTHCLINSEEQNIIHQGSVSDSMTTIKNISDEQTFVNSPTRSASKTFSCLNTFGTEVILSRSSELDKNLVNTRTSFTRTECKLFSPFITFLGQISFEFSH